MRKARKVHVVAALVAAFCAWLLVSAGAAAAAQQKVAWAKCFGGPFQCGTLQVPLDYDRPNGSKIALGLTRLPATDPDHRIGSLLINPGGPGGPGSAFIVEFGPDLFTPEVRARYDLVGFDPRGISTSAALRCFGNDRQWEPFFQPFAFPMDADELELWIAGEHFLDDACARRGGAIAEHMATANVARDMDRLRAAVGDARLHYYGVSYGSFLGTTYANLFPERVGRLVVDGVLDPVAWTTGVGDEAETIPFSTRLHSDAGAWATLQEFFRLCDAGGDRCAFSGGAEDRYAQLAEDLLAAPKVIPFPDGTEGELNYSVLVAITLNFLYFSPDWPELAQLLADFESAPGSNRVRMALRRYSRSSGWVSHRSFPRYFNALEGGPARVLHGFRQPGLVRRVVAAAVAADAERAVLRARVDLDQQHLRRLAVRRLRPLHRPVGPRDREPGAGGRQPVRPGDAVLGRADGRRDAAGRAAVDAACVGSYVGVLVELRRRGDRALPRRRRPAAGRHRLRAGRGAVRAIGDPDNARHTSEARPRARGHDSSVPLRAGRRVTREHWIMSVEEILTAHPRPPIAEVGVLAACIDECVACAATCTICADACLAEPDIAALARCIRLCLDCADACVDAGRILSRQTDPDADVQLTALKACLSACRACAAECERHARHHEHCRLSADECRRCERACDDLLAALGGAWASGRYTP